MIRSKNQILITGCYRSGTEYITLLMNNHPDLSASMYVVSFMRFCYGKYDPIEKEVNYSKLVFDVAQRIRSRWHRKLDVHKILDCCENVERVTYPFLYNLIMSELFLSDKVQVWAEKTQLVWTKIPHFLEMFPRGKAIQIIRDPRSVLASFKKYTYAPGYAYLGAIFNCYDAMKLGLEYKDRSKAERYYVVKYEDVVTSPKKTLIDLFDFLELSSDHDLLSQKGWKDAKGNPWHHNSAFLPDEAQGHAFDKQTAVERWKNNLFDWEIALCEAVTGEVMGSYGYEHSDISEEWEIFLRPLLAEDKLTGYLQQWITEARGVEEFPTDPLKPENWEENVLS